MNRLPWMLAAAMAVVLVGCASGGAAVATTPQAAPAAAGADGVQALTALRLEQKPEPRLVAETSGRPAYTGYHPQPDVYVVDLMKTVKQPGLVLPTNLPDTIASIAADEVLELGKPMTRITVRFREPVAAFASAAGTGVAIGFDLPQGGSETLLAANDEPAEDAFATEPLVAPEMVVESEPIDETVPAETPAATVAETAAEPEPLLRPAPPVREPAPVPTHPATRLAVVRTTGTGASLTVELEGDGRLDYNDFKLTDPLRLVFDVPGTKNAVERSTIPITNPFVRQIRVAQFKGGPDPVTRVVLDLDEYVDHRVTRDGGKLLISFGPSEPVFTEPEAADAELVASLEPPRAKPAASIAEIDPRPPAAPTETAIIRGPQTPTPQQAPLLQESPNVTTPQPAPDLIETDEDVFRIDEGPEVTGGNIETRTLSGPDQIFTGEPIDLNLTNADIRDVLRTFSELTGLNMAIDPNVSGSVTVAFEDVPWDQALAIILRQNNLGWNIQGNVMRIGTLDRLAAEQAQERRLAEERRLNVELTTVIKRLSYAKAAEVAALAQNLASPRGRVIVDERTNQLIITDVPDYLPTMLNLIENVDIATPQVMIEARIVETTKTFSRELGIDWNFGGILDPAIGTGTGLVFPNRIEVGGGPFFDTLVGQPILTFGLSDVLGAFDLDLTLAAAESEGLARIISSPKIVTQDNTAAQIQSGLQIPFQTRVNFTTTVQFIDATLQLIVTPQITAEDTVIMDIQVQKVEPSELVAGAPQASLSTRRAQTRLMVRDGGTAVIGGIYQANDTSAENRVPFVHDIPVVGNLFKQRTQSNRNDELLIFITPRIIRNF